MLTSLLFGGSVAAFRKRIGRDRPSSRSFQLERLEDRCVMSADPVLFWNGVMLQAAVNDYAIWRTRPTIRPDPQPRGRSPSFRGAVYDAVNSIEPDYTPYLIQVSAPRGASVNAAVAEAAYTTLVSLYPYQKSFFDSQLALSLQNIATTAKIEGMAVGLTVANYILAARANDGSQVDAVGQPVNYTYGQQPGQWRADPLHPNATPLTPDWGSVTPFVVQSATQFGAPPPPAITSLAYAQAYEQVKALGSVDSTVRTDNETDIGFFWGYDAQPGLCAPVRFYNQIAEAVAVKMGNSVEDNARFFALINFAEADAAITCWNDKYRYDLWRPIGAIRENDPGTGPTGLGSGNPYLVGQGDPTWQPLGAPADNGNGTNFTPPFPFVLHRPRRDWRGHVQGDGRFLSHRRHSRRLDHHFGRVQHHHRGPKRRQPAVVAAHLQLLQPNGRGKTPKVASTWVSITSSTPSKAFAPATPSATMFTPTQRLRSTAHAPSRWRRWIRSNKFAWPSCSKTRRPAAAFTLAAPTTAP